MGEILRGVQAEILGGVYPEPNAEILRFAQNDSEGLSMTSEGLRMTKGGASITDCGLMMTNEAPG